MISFYYGSSSGSAKVCNYITVPVPGGNVPVPVRRKPSLVRYNKLCSSFLLPSYSQFTAPLVVSNVSLSPLFSPGPCTNHSLIYTEAHFHFLYRCWLSEGNLFGVLGRVLNSGLPYSTPAHCHLSYSTPSLSQCRTLTELRRTITELPRTLTELCRTPN